MSIELKDISYVYMPKTPFEHLALDNVTITIPDGSITAIAGHTGSGKSTLIQHLNGLLQPAAGTVAIDGTDIWQCKDKSKVKAAKRSVGMVFQYPEHQLFEETVEADIAFGPKNYGCSADEIATRVRDAMAFVRLDYEKYSKRSPFQLSGGQMRRVAIAGVVALKPKYLVLDEPTAGLDPQGREDLLQRIRELHAKEKTTIVIVSHNMDDIARLADKVIILNKGKVAAEGKPADGFKVQEIIQQAGVEVPQITQIMVKLQQAGLSVNSDIYIMDKAVEAIAQAVRGRSRC